MQLTQKLGAYANVQANSCPFDGRNCTADEVFPRLVLRPLPQGRFRNRRTDSMPCGKVRKTQFKKGAFQKETIRVCSGSITSYATPRQRILRVMREFAKFTRKRNGWKAVTTL